MHWRIGDGTNVDVWLDNWIPRNHHGFKPFTPSLSGMKETSLSVLINMDSGTWDDYLVLLFMGE